VFKVSTRDVFMRKKSARRRLSCFVMSGSVFGDAEASFLGLSRGGVWRDQAVMPALFADFAFVIEAPKRVDEAGHYEAEPQHDFNQDAATRDGFWLPLVPAARAEHGDAFACELAVKVPAKRT
jgi:hypothetical protein